MTAPTTQPTRWPDEPAPSASSRDRLAWYAAVARWAPSKHNTQPWRFVVTGTSLEVWADLSRALPASDPGRRELVLSCGAAVHLAEVAARAHGYRLQVEGPHGGVEDCLARLTEAGPWDARDEDRALLDRVPLRRTDRGPLDGDALPPGLVFDLQSEAAAAGALLRLVATPGDRATLAALVERADRLLVQQADVEAETALWLRGPDDPRPDGVPTDHSRGAAASYRAGFVQRDFSSPSSAAGQDRPGVDCPVVGVLCTPGDGVADWLAAGRGLSALLLRASLCGARASYLNQPVEHGGLRTQLREQLGLAGVPQMVLRLGIGAPVPPTPRRAPVDVVVSAL